MARESSDPLIRLVVGAAGPVIKILQKSSLTPNNITLVSFFFFDLPAAFLLSSGKLLFGLIALFLLLLASWFDIADGTIARLKNLCSPVGAWLDPAIDLISKTAIVSGMILGAFVASGKNQWLILGILVLFGLLLTDCISIEYKYRFKFDPYSGLQLFKEKLQKDKVTFLDFLFGQIVMPTYFWSSLLFTVRYWIVLGVITNKWWISVIGLLIFLNVRWVTMFYIFGSTYSEKKSRFKTVEILKILKNE